MTALFAATYALPDVRRLPFELESSSNTHEIRPPIPQAPGAGDRRRIGLALIRLQIETEIHATDVSRVRQ
jgi:hypothetical protein